MGAATFVRFVKLCLSLSLLAFFIAAVVSPPEPFIGIVYFVVLLPVVIVIAYIFS